MSSWDSYKVSQEYLDDSSPNAVKLRTMLKVCEYDTAQVLGGSSDMEPYKIAKMID